MEYLVPKQLETERLLLRQFQEDDWKGLHDYYADPVATKFTVGRPLSEAETWRAMAAMLGHWQLRGYGPYAVVEQATKKLIGPIGFWYPNDWPSPEIKFALAPRYWGQGFSGEAIRAIRVAGKKHMPHVSLISLIRPENRSAIKLVLSLEATFDKEIPFHAARWRIYRHPD